MSTVYYDNINGFSQLKMKNGKLYGRLNSGEWQEIETGGEQGEPGAPGVSSYVYWAWCADPATGAGFSLTDPADYISFITRNTVLVSPQFSDFSTWVKYVGSDGKNGADGVSTYVYYAYASDADGTNFSLSPADSLNYQAILVTHTEITSPSLSDFAGMFYHYKCLQTSGHNIFDIFYSMSSKAPAGAMDLSLGTLIASCDTVFPDFWSECVARKAEGSIRTLTEEEWKAEVTANGSCGAFVVDEEAKSVRLPKITNMIQPGDVGVFTKAGLPNITGQYGYFRMQSASDYNTGALYSVGGNSTIAAIGTDSSAPNTLALDASRSSSIYGNSTTVQPPAVGAKLYIQVFTSAVPASMAQAGEFINMLEAKADKTELDSLQPAGTVIAFAGNSAPTGYLICNGAAVSRTTYAKLFAIIGTTYGTGDGSTTFNLPNLTDKFIQGSGTAGTTKAAGVPNINAMFVPIPIKNSSSGNVSSPIISYSGALTMSHETDRSLTGFQISPVTLSSSLYRYNFAASSSNAIYGNSTTVQPPALTMRFYIKY